ncbi:HAMP domain-containing sensor histidine kinase [Chengkuizengella sp. SCS-71B]|uniref:HAMP domain-containing sensor histidine kinase n=1 Tax=Chengkuizengella sp. SCS-71B TaxID=3115290 RepID=UPI0032C2373A
MSFSNVINFCFFTLLDYAAGFILIFTFFRMSISKYLLKIIFSSLLLLYVSFSLRAGFNMEYLAPIFQMFFIFLLFWQLFRLKFLHAIVVSAVGYSGYSVIQIIIISFLNEPDLSLFSIDVYILQTLSFIVTMIIVFILKKFNIGYSLLSNQKDKTIKSLIELPILFLVLMSFINVVGMYYFLNNQKFIILYGLFVLIFIILLLKIILKNWKINFNQQVLSKTLKTMDTGTSIFNHTIKNEISKINLLVNQLSEDVEGKDNNQKMKKNIKKILNSTKHMNEMTVRIKEKMEDVDLTISNINLYNLIQEVTKDIQSITRDCNITINKNVEDDIVIQGDLTHIREVLMNILNNFIEALKNCSNSQINIEILKDNKFIKLIVKDNGSGIPKELQDKVLDPFFSSKKTSNNHGLGLTYSYNIMKKHNGVLKIISEEQQGTEIALWFPKRKSESF